MRFNSGTCGEVPEVHGRRFACFGFGAIGFCESKNRVWKNQDRSTRKACKKSREGPSLDIWAHRGLVWKCSALIMPSLVSNLLRERLVFCGSGFPAATVAARMPLPHTD